MPIRVDFRAGNDTHQFDNQIQAVITDVFNKHPFFSQTVKPPHCLTIRVSIGDIFNDNRFNTSINYDSFFVDQSADLMIEKLDLHHGSSPFNPPSIVPRCLEKIIAHELGHFIDACLDQAFQYAHAHRPSGNLRMILNDLWNSYIDARLGSLAPCTLQERQQEAACRRVPAPLIERAWNSEFKTYPTLLGAARDVSTLRT